MDIYRETILDHYKHPRNFGHLSSPHGVARGANATCGDEISMEVIVTGASQTISDIRFHGAGCAISQAAASLLTEEVKGKNVRDIGHIGTADIINLLGTELTPSRVKCAVLPLEVLQKAILSVSTT